MMVTSEYVGRPRRWATGIELAEEPVLDDDGDPGPRRRRPAGDDGGQSDPRRSPGDDLGERRSEVRATQRRGPRRLRGQSVRVILGQIMAVSTLPAHYVGVFTDNPASADALRAAEASLTARAEARQATFGRAWEQVARLMIAVRDGRDPDMIDDIRVQWADAATRSVAQEADAVVKLFQAGILPGLVRACASSATPTTRSPRSVPRAAPKRSTPRPSTSASWSTSDAVSGNLVGVGGCRVKPPRWRCGRRSSQLGDDLLAAALAAVLAAYNGRAVSLAVTAFAAQASIAASTPVPVELAGVS